MFSFILDLFVIYMIISAIVSYSDTVESYIRKNVPDKIRNVLIPGVAIVAIFDEYVIKKYTKK